MGLRRFQHTCHRDIVDDYRSCFRCHQSVAFGLARPALVRAAHDAVDAADLQVAAIPASGVPTTTHQLCAQGLIALGLWLGLEHTSLTPGQRRATWLAILIPDTFWFAVAWSAAITGVFHPGTTPLPALPLAIFLPVIIGAPLLPFRSESDRCSTRCHRSGSSRFSSTAVSAAGLLRPGC
jgi:hypothetical protein